MQEQLRDSTHVPLDYARAYLKWYFQQSGQKVRCPTASELQAGIESGQLVSTGPEWTHEGWIYDPQQQLVNKRPSVSMVATFRTFPDTRRRLKTQRRGR